jgi:hypothetical protein
LTLRVLGLGARNSGLYRKYWPYIKKLKNPKISKSYFGPRNPKNRKIIIICFLDSWDQNKILKFLDFSIFLYMASISYINRYSELPALKPLRSTKGNLDYKTELKQVPGGPNEL